MLEHNIDIVVLSCQRRLAGVHLHIDKVEYTRVPLGDVCSELHEVGTTSDGFSDRKKLELGLVVVGPVQSLGLGRVGEQKSYRED